MARHILGFVDIGTFARLTGLAAAVLIASGCTDVAYRDARDQALEGRIRAFFDSAERRLEIGGAVTEPFIALCLLEPYESRLSDRDNTVVGANEFLTRIDLKSDESHWHLVMQRRDQFRLVRIPQRSVPLSTPRMDYLKAACIRSDKFDFTKVVSPRGDRLKLSTGG